MNQTPARVSQFLAAIILMAFGDDSVAANVQSVEEGGSDQYIAKDGDFLVVPVNALATTLEEYPNITAQSVNRVALKLEDGTYYAIIDARTSADAAPKADGSMEIAKMGYAAKKGSKNTFFVELQDGRQVIDQAAANALGAISGCLLREVGTAFRTTAIADGTFKKKVWAIAVDGTGEAMEIHDLTASRKLKTFDFGDQGIVMAVQKKVATLQFADVASFIERGDISDDSIDLAAQLDGKIVQIAALDQRETAGYSFHLVDDAGKGWMYNVGSGQLHELPDFDGAVVQLVDGSGAQRGVTKDFAKIKRESDDTVHFQRGSAKDLGILAAST